jgi:putative ABC transport system permease protein
LGSTAVGFAIYFALMIDVTEVIRVQTGVVLDVWAGGAMLWICPLAMIGLCALGGAVPALKAYRTPVAETLAPVS